MVGIEREKLRICPSRGKTSKRVTRYMYRETYKTRRTYGR